MKKTILASLAAAVLALASSSFAQSADHSLDVTIPTLLQLEIVATVPTTGPAVVFDYNTALNSPAYFAAVNGGGGALATTSTTDFDDIRVFSNAADWTVSVGISAPTFTPTIALATAAGIAGSDFTVTPSGTASAGVTTAGSYTLDGATDVATGTATGGWANLGISGTDYSFFVNGDEEPGDYAYTVTYTVTAP